MNLVYRIIYPHIYFFNNPFKFYEFRELMKRSEMLRSHQVLDVGCGSGLQTTILGKLCDKIIGIDISAKDIARAESERYLTEGKVNVEYVCTSLQEAGFTSEMFDAVFSICVLEHVPDYQGLLKEIARVLRPRSPVIISVDSLSTITNQQLIETHRSKYKVVEYFTMDKLYAVLEDAGFVEIEISPVFCSQYARNLFERGIADEFRYRYRQSIRDYLLLMWHEARNTQVNEGIFLVAKARKPL